MNNLNQDYNFTKSLKQYIKEGLRLSIDDQPEMLQPKTCEELRQIIDDRYKEFGPGTISNPIDFNDIDVSRITTFNDFGEGLFENTCFEYIDISDWDVSSVESMRATFWACAKLKSIGDISNWDVSRVEYMNGMFCKCESLKELNLSNWNVSRVESMWRMFMNCEKLESIGDISDWDVSNVKDMTNMFYDCHNLQSIGDISNWDVSNVKINMFMFIGSGIKNIPDWF